MTDRTLKQSREEGLNDLAKVIQHIYGDRCTRKEAGCMCCVAWGVFDMLESLTDSSLIDDHVSISVDDKVFDELQALLNGPSSRNEDVAALMMTDVDIRAALKAGDYSKAEQLIYERGREWSPR